MRSRALMIGCLLCCLASPLANAQSGVGPAVGAGSCCPAMGGGWGSSPCSGVKDACSHDAVKGTIICGMAAVASSIPHPASRVIARGLTPACVVANAETVACVAHSQYCKSLGLAFDGKSCVPCQRTSGSAMNCAQALMQHAGGSSLSNRNGASAVGQMAPRVSGVQIGCGQAMVQHAGRAGIGNERCAGASAEGGRSGGATGSGCARAMVSAGRVR
jgi:hypothetical protein